MILRILTIFTVIFSITLKTYAQDGAAIFKSNCASCHALTDKKITGPGLAGFWDRIPGGDEAGKQKWFNNWVKNAPSIINAKSDPYINKLYAEVGSPMTGFPQLSDESLVTLATYIKDYKAPAAMAGTGTGEKNPFLEVQAEDDSTTYYWLIILAVVFFIVINALGGVKRSLQKLADEKAGVKSAPPISFLKSVLRWILSHKFQFGLILIVVISIVTVKKYVAINRIGVFQGYAPEQPIKFSHQIHAGKNKISCVYCHHTAEKSKHSGIPSVNVCMNCHKGIQEGTWTGTSEISKIHEAAGFNATTGKYDKPETPIRWVRIHNLPDLAYFNHSQHVAVGKIECQQCHGPVEEMTVMRQHSDLTMGWCIDCHRRTDVKMEGNKYYDKMLGELKEKHKGEKVFQVEDIGGLECSKCHY